MGPGALGHQAGADLAACHHLQIKASAVVEPGVWNRAENLSLGLLPAPRVPVIFPPQPAQSSGTQKRFEMEALCPGRQLHLTQNTSSFPSLCLALGAGTRPPLGSAGPQFVGKGGGGRSVLCFPSVPSPVWVPGAWSLPCFLQRWEPASLRLQLPRPDLLVSLDQRCVFPARTSPPGRSRLLFLLPGPLSPNPSWPLRPAVRSLLPGHCRGALMVGLGLGGGLCREWGVGAKIAPGTSLGWAWMSFLRNRLSPDSRGFFKGRGDQSEVCFRKMFLLLQEVTCQGTESLS